MLKKLVSEIMAGLTVAVVALPLALGFGVAATGTPEGAVLGLYGAIFTGFFAAIFGGTPAQVTGPTGPITVVITSIIVKYGIAEAMTATIMAGFIQILFSILKFGKLLKYISQPVISGFMNGIALIIILTQSDAVHNALFIVLLTILIVVIVDKFIKVIPASLAGLLFASIAVLCFQQYFPHSSFCLPILGEVSWGKEIQLIGTIPHGIPSIIIPKLDQILLLKLLLPALSIAILGSIDSLLTSVVMDSITGKKHDSNRELLGQGIGNIMAGFFGGIAGAGATVRSVVNVKCGGKTALSGAFHSIVLLSFMMLLSKWVSQIPLAVLGGILIVTGFSMFDYVSLKKVLHTSEKLDSLIMLVTMILTVMVDLMVAVGVGVTLTILKQKFYTSHKTVIN